MRHQRAADRDHLLLAPRQRAGDLPQAFLDPREEREDARQILVELGAATARIGAHFEVLVDRHAREQAARLQHRGDAAAHPLGRPDPVQGMPLVDDLAAGRAHDSHDRLHRRRLARRVAAQQADNFASLDPVVDRLQHVEVAVMGVDRPEFEERSAHA